LDSTALDAGSIEVTNYNYGYKMHFSLFLFWIISIACSINDSLIDFRGAVSMS